MREITNEYQLAREITARSVADNWAQAKLEWDVLEIHYEEEAETCLCGHYPINELCTLINRRNGNTALVGNVCVTRFLGHDSSQIFQGIRRISKDSKKALNVASIEHAFARGWITEWERGFLIDTARKRVLTAKQQAKREELNRKFLEKTRNSLRKHK